MMKSAASDRQLEELVESLSRLGAVHTKRFFGGTALLRGTTQFAYYVKGELYFRVDDTTRERFERAGSRPFSYMRGAREVSLSAYYLVPEDLLDRQDDLLQWARDAVTSAHSAQRRRK